MSLVIVLYFVSGSLRNCVRRSVPKDVGDVESTVLVVSKSVRGKRRRMSQRGDTGDYDGALVCLEVVIPWSITRNATNRTQKPYRLVAKEHGRTRKEC